MATENWNHGGYTAPSSVKSRDDVRALQRQLGVKADGLWGKNTQAAYEKSLASQASSSGSSSSSSGSTRNTNRTYKVNGQVVSSGSNRSGGSISGHTTYGNGDYGGKYLGSNQTAAYQNMVNAPGSTGYEKGTLSGYARRKDENGDIYYEHVSREGVLPLGTSFQATGAALADAQGVPDSSGIFAYAKGRTPGYVNHVSGYSGMGYQDAKGNFYDANGNFLREDNFYYEPGAKISKNGMYQDTGSGWGHAGYGMWGSPGNYIAVKGENYGKAPGTQLETFTRGSGGGSRESAPVQQEAAVEPVIQQIVQAAAKKDLEDLERRRMQEAWGNSGGALAF